MSASQGRFRSAFIDQGWAGTQFLGRPAYRGPGGWVACRIPGEGLALFRDTYQGICHFATYRTPGELLADVKAAMRANRTRTETEMRDNTPTPVYGAWEQSDRWPADDPRWG